MVLESVKEGKTNRKPQPPFTTESMLRAANGRMGWSIGRTNRVATALYQSGHITYIEPILHVQVKRPEIELDP